MYLQPSDKHWILDIETDGLDATKIWVMSVKNAITKEKHSFTDYDQIRDFIQTQSNRGCWFVGHNIIGFDAPVLNRIANTRLTISRLVDSFLLSMCYSPSLVGGHSIEAWAKRIGKVKPEHKEWHVYSREMLYRNQQDVEINWEMYLKLTKRMVEVGITEQNVELEHKAWHIIQNKQKKNGFWFDQPKGHELFANLRGVEQELRRDIYEVFPPQLQMVAEYKQAFKKDGTYNQNYKRHIEQFPEIRVREDGSYEALDWVEFDLGSPKQRVDKLLGAGWQPREFTPAGNPKPTAKGDLSPSLAEFVEESGIKEIKLIADWISVNARANMIGNWLDLYNEKTGCIHGQLWLAGTLRYRHDNPNTANIPGVPHEKETGAIKWGRSGLWKADARNLWGTRDPNRRRLVGVDAKAVQLRVLAHHLGDEEYADYIINPERDIHTLNQQITGIATRDKTKTFTYAVLLGAGSEKVAAICGTGVREGGRIKRRFIEGVPGLSRLYGRLEKELERSGRIGLCDGGRVLVPSPHMVLAYLLQGDESRIMKQAAIYVDEKVRRKGLDVLKVGDIHDEWQSDVLAADTAEYERVCVEAFREAGESFNYSVPIECEAKVGYTWAETH